MIIVMEVQVFGTGQVSTPCYAFENRNSAEQKYHTILSAAAVSSLPRHTAYMLTDDGMVLKAESYAHEVAPEPESEE